MSEDYQVVTSVRNFDAREVVSEILCGGRPGIDERGLVPDVSEPPHQVMPFRIRRRKLLR
jgi:hypothetical protein